MVRPEQQQRLNEGLLTSGGRFGGAFKLNYILTNGSSAPLPVDGLPTACGGAMLGQTIASRYTELVVVRYYYYCNIWGGHRPPAPRTAEH